MSFGKLLNQRLAECKRGGAAPAILLVRVDDYSPIVAKHGKHVGNLVLHATTQFLSAALRDMDLVAQHGVATFAVLLPGTKLGDLAGVAERLREAISHCRCRWKTASYSLPSALAGPRQPATRTP